MVLVVWFSSDRWSAEHTGPVVGFVLQWSLPWLTPPQVELVHTIVRKCAHVTEYAILARLWLRALVRGHRCSTYRAAWGALVISVAWAALDEVHQAFT